MYKEQLKKISEIEWEIPRQGKMNVPGKIFASEKLLKDITLSVGVERLLGFIPCCYNASTPP